MNLHAIPGDQSSNAAAAAEVLSGQCVKTIRPNNTDPIPVPQSQPRMGKIIVRFVVLLAIAVVVLALAWSR